MLGLLAVLWPAKKATGQDNPKSSTAASTAAVGFFPGNRGPNAGNTSEAATQNRLSDVPVNLYTGTPVINFPIYTLQEGALAVPISLGYTGGGLRANDIASWCGLGWTLQAGGMVTRQVRGLPDEGSPNGGTFKGYYRVGWNSANNQDDHEPDLFIANCNGQVVKFMLDADRIFRPIPDADVKIEASWRQNRANGSLSWISGFKITFPDGMIYRFGGYDQPTVELWEYVISKPLTDPVPSANDASLLMPTAWNLRSIRSAQGQQITFEYARVYYSYPQLVDQQVNGLQGTGYAPPLSLNRVYVSSEIITAIRGANTTIEFNPTTTSICSQYDQLTGVTIPTVCSAPTPDVNRYDLQNWVLTSDAFPKILKRIYIRDNHDAGRNLNYYFNYGYFEGSSSTPRNALPAGYTYNQVGNNHLKRLKMTGFTMPDGTTCSFAYANETNDFPSTLVRGIDHWGFFNGTEPRHLIGKGDCQNTNPDWFTNRTPTLSWAIYGSLSKITLSSGIETQLNYESHQAHDYGEVGGIRIKQIVTKDAISNLTTIKEYDYSDPENGYRQSGFLSLKPVYRFSEANDLSQVYYNSYLYQSALARSGKPIVGYAYVKETVYSGTDLNPVTFDRGLYKTGSVASWFDQDENPVGTCDGSVDFSHTPWKYHPDQDLRAGSLKKQQVRNRADQRITETELTYDTRSAGYSTGARNILVYNDLTVGTSENYSPSINKYRIRSQVNRQFDQNGNNQIESRTEYYYKEDMDGTYLAKYPGKHNQSVKIKTWDSKGQAIENQVLYAADFEFGTENYTVRECDYDVCDRCPPDCRDVTYTRPRQPATEAAQGIRQLKLLNMGATVVETNTQKNGKCLAATYSTFNYYNGRTTRVYSLNQFPITGFTPAYYNASNDEIAVDSRHKQRVSYDEYNDIGMPVRVRSTNGDGTTTRIVYDHNNLLPISVTEDHGEGRLSMTTSYTYFPLWGVATQRLPNGTGLNYSYDGIGRLKGERNQNNQILKRIEYKRKDQ